MLKSKRLLGALAGAALLGAVIVPSVAWAQGTVEPTPAEVVTPFHGGLKGGLGHGVRLEALAEALGVTTDALRAAITQVREAFRPTERPATRPTEEERAAKRAEVQAALAAALGVSAEQLDAAIESLRPTAEEIEAKRAEMLAAARAALEARLGDAVTAGRLTQAQADAVLAAFDSGDLRGGFGFHGRGGPRGGSFAPGIGSIGMRF